MKTPYINVSIVSLLLIFLSSMFFTNLERDIRPEIDQHLYQYLAAIDKYDHESKTELYHKVSSIIEENGNYKWAETLRIYNDMPSVYSVNNLSYRIIHNYLSPKLTDKQINYNYFISNVIVYGYIFAYLSSIVIFIFLLYLLNDQRIVINIFFTLIAIVLVNLIINNLDFYLLGYEANTRLLSRPGILGKVLNLFFLFLIPDDISWIFGYYPRCSLILLALISFAARWKGNYSLSYFILILAIFYHQSMAILLISIVMFLDLIKRVYIFKNKSIILYLISAFLIVAFKGDKLISSFYMQDNFYLLFLILSLILSIIILSIKFQLFDRFNKLMSRVNKLLEKFSDINSDIILLLFMFIITFPLVALIAFFERDFFNFTFFWDSIHGRIVIIMQPILFYSFINQLFNTNSILIKKIREIKFIFSFLFIITTVSFVYSFNIITNTSLITKKMEKGYKALNIKIINGGVIDINENIIFYSIAKELDTNDNSIEILVPLMTKKIN